jgi:hypothetical protein
LQNHTKVIPFPRSGWRFFDYLEGGQNLIEDWYQNDLTQEGRDIFDALLRANQKVELPSDWGGSKAMQGDCKEEGIWEWRFYADDRQQRILGIFGDVRKHAIFLIGCYHKDKVYTPPDALKTAIRRAKTIRSGRASVRERKIKQNI